MRQPFLENLYSFCKAQLQDPHCLWPIPCPLLQPWQRAHLCPQSFTSPATAALTWPHFYPGSLQDYLFLQLLQPCNLTGKISEQQSLIMLAYEREETTTNISEIINRFRFKLGYFLPTPVTRHWVCASRKLQCLEILIYYGVGNPCHAMCMKARENLSGGDVFLLLCRDWLWQHFYPVITTAALGGF